MTSSFLPRTVHLDGDVRPYRLWLPPVRDVRGGPLVLFLHGSGERGTDGELPTTVGLGEALRAAPQRWPFPVLFPQAREGETWCGDAGRAALAMLAETESELGTDPDRVVVTGLSLGGNGAWYLAWRHPERLAGVAVACGFVTGGEDGTDFVPPEDAEAAGDAHAALARRIARVPVRIFHRTGDPVVPVEASRRMHRALMDAGADVAYEETPGESHDAWDTAYRASDLPEWIQGLHRGGD